MTTMAHGHVSKTSTRLGKLARAVTNVRVTVTVPATASVRDAVMADFYTAHCLDMSDDDRAKALHSARS